MKRFLLLSALLITVTGAITRATEQQITFHKATETNILQIINFIDTHAAQKQDKKIDFPKNYKRSIIHSQIANNKLYYATNKNSIIAFKKLFIINDSNFYQYIAECEIRCKGSKITRENSYIIENNISKNTSEPSPCYEFNNSLIISLGKDFAGNYTIATEGKDELNYDLLSYAFQSIQEDTVSTIQKKNPLYIVLLYVLTKENDVINNDLNQNPAIIQAFNNFIKKVIDKCYYTYNNQLYHNIYKTFVSTYDPNSNDRLPLPDDQSMAGDGNELIYTIVNNINKVPGY